MPNALKYSGYVLLFIISFFFFLYWTFPYNVLKERLITTTEQKLGEDYDVKIGDLSPSFFTGAVLENVKVLKHESDKVVTVWEAQKVRVRASIFSIIFGRTTISFSIKNQKSSLSGTFRNTDDGFNFTGDFSNFNIGDFGFSSGGENGAKLTSAIDGAVKLNINKRQIIQSTGTVNLTLADMKVKGGEIKMGEGMNFTIPDLVISKGSSSTLKLDLSKGVVQIKEFKFQDGDLKVDLTGELYMSSVFKNYRMNLKGNFGASPKLEQAVPILFMVEKQKQADGTYPLTVTGRIGQPSIKIGDFTLPL